MVAIDKIYTNSWKEYLQFKHPLYKYNIPYECKNRFINAITLDGLPYMWYSKKYNSWNFSGEFVLSKWSINTAYCKTIKSLKRFMIKWKLPVGTTIKASGKYIDDYYEFTIKL